MYIITLIFPKELEDFGIYLLSDLQSYPRLQLIVVMIIIPFVLNCFQFWVVDNFLKESDESRISRMAKGQKLLAQVRWEDFENKRRSNDNIFEVIRNVGEKSKEEKD
jgi:hypothetical protein